MDQIQNLKSSLISVQKTGSNELKDQTQAENTIFTILDRSSTIHELNRARISEPFSVKFEISEDTGTGLKCQATNSYYFALALEVLSEQLSILNLCNTNLRIDNLLASHEKLCQLKFGIKEVETDEISRPLDSTVHKVQKMINDREILDQIVGNTCRELLWKGTFESLLDGIESLQHNAKCAAALEQKVATNKITLQNFKKVLFHFRAVFKAEEYAAITHIEELKSNIKDNEQINVNKELYTHKWQSSRAEQLLYKLEKAEENTCDEIRYYKNRFGIEDLVHDDIDQFNAQILMDLQSKIEDIMVKYDEDTEAMDLKIGITRKNYLDVVDKAANMAKKLKKQAKEMKEWIQFTEERESARKYERDMNAAAIVVQAWWRGLLQRLQLGPYKKKAKGSKKGKKEKRASIQKTRSILS